MFFYNIIYIIQAKSESFYLLGIPLRHTEEFFKYVLHVLRWYTHSIVPDRYDTVPVIFRKINMYLHRTIGVFDGIVYDIMKGGLKVKLVTLYESRTSAR